MGACSSLDDIACCVVTTVVSFIPRAVGDCGANQFSYFIFVQLSHYPRRREILVDAGALALSKDLGAFRPVTV